MTDDAVGVLSLPCCSHRWPFTVTPFRTECCPWLWPPFPAPPWMVGGLAGAASCWSSGSRESTSAVSEGEWKGLQDSWGLWAIESRLLHCHCSWWQGICVTCSPVSFMLLSGSSITSVGACVLRPTTTG